MWSNGGNYLKKKQWLFDAIRNGGYCKDLSVVWEDTGHIQQLRWCPRLWTKLVELSMFTAGFVVDS